MAKEQNDHDYDLDIGLFEYATGGCAVCHPGGGALEHDRQGNRYDTYLKAGHTPAALNGDYYYYNSSSGDVELSTWDETGVLEVDCLMCHMEGYSTDVRATEVISKHLSAAPFAGAGFGTVTDNDTVTYDGSLASNGIALREHAEFHLTCNQCHAMDENGFFTASTSLKSAKADPRKRGLVWGEGGVLQTATTDYRGIHDKEGMSCLDCHSAGIDHQITKGNARVGNVRDDLDFTVTSCQACHVDDTNDGDKVGVDPTSAHEAAGFGGIYSFHMDKVACEACHIPYKGTFAFRTVDISSGQMFNAAGTSKIKGKYGLPAGGTPDPSSWTEEGLKFCYQWWLDSDGKYKLHPMNMMTCIFWNEGDDISHPYFLRYVLNAGAELLSEGKIHNDIPNPYYEINTAQEIADMRDKLIAVGSTVGDPRMTDPKLWVSADYFSVSHSIREASDALGANGCTDCHDSAANGGTDRWFFDGEFMVWNFEYENSPYLRSEVKIILNDGSQGEVDVDFSVAGHNKISNWKLMGYTQAEHDQLVTPKTP